jgi:hypothetical protein
MKMLRRALLVILATPLVCTAAARVEYADGRLTAHFEEADVIDVVRTVAAEARLDIRGAPVAAHPVSIRLDAVPLAEALPRLLAGQSFVLTYAGDHVRGVRFLNSSAAIGPLAIPATPEAAPEDPEAESGSLAASHRVVPIGGRLARAVGADHTRYSDIMSVAMQNPDPRIRADALRVGLRIVDEEPALQSDLVATLDNLDDQALARWLTKVAGEHAAEIARRTARRSRTGPLRQRAAAVARLIEAGDAATPGG